MLLQTTSHHSVCNVFGFDSQGEDGVPGEDGRKVCGPFLKFFILSESIKIIFSKQVYLSGESHIITVTKKINKISFYQAASVQSFHF